MNFTDFTSWDILATYTGALGMVLLLTQLTKELPGIIKLPTQLWSYLLALGVLYASYYFTHQLTPDNAVLILFNAATVSLGANGGFDLARRIMGKSDGGGKDA